MKGPVTSCEDVCSVCQETTHLPWCPVPELIAARMVVEAARPFLSSLTYNENYTELRKVLAAYDAVKEGGE